MNFSFFHTVTLLLWKLWKFAFIHFWQKFRESNVSTVLIEVLVLNNRNDEIFFGESKFFIFPYYDCNTQCGEHDVEIMEIYYHTSSVKISLKFKKKRHFPNSWKNEHCWPAIGPKVDKKFGSFNPYSISHLPSKQKWTIKLAISICTLKLDWYAGV